MILDASVAGNAAGSIDDGVVVASVFHVGDRRVHGPDADDLTMLSMPSKPGGSAGMRVLLTSNSAKMSDRLWLRACLGDRGWGCEARGAPLPVRCSGVGSRCEHR